MNSKRVYFLLLASTALSLVLLLGGAYAIDTLLQKKSDQLVTLKLQSQTLDQQQTGLKKAKQEIAKYAQLEAITQAVVPQDKDQAEAVREIVNIAEASNVHLSNITFPASTLGAGAGSSPSSPTAAANSKSALSQLQPVKGIPGVYQLQITIQNNESYLVTYGQFYSFLQRLENNRRTAQVANLVIQPSNSSRNLITFTLTLNEYIKP